MVISQSGVQFDTPLIGQGRDGDLNNFGNDYFEITVDIFMFY
jgi:hypothetical protein